MFEEPSLLLRMHGQCVAYGACEVPAETPLANWKYIAVYMKSPGVSPWHLNE